MVDSKRVVRVVYVAFLAGGAVGLERVFTYTAEIGFLGMTSVADDDFIHYLL